MKTKQKVDITASILFLLAGTFLLVCPVIGITNVNLLFIITMAYYTIINLGKYLLTKENHDFEGLLSAISSLLIGSLAILNYSNEKASVLALLLFGWVILQAFVKLKKADYYNDRKSKLWILEISFLILFIILGILSSINLYHSNDVRVLVIGFFFFTHGVLELVDPVMIFLMKEKIKN